MKGLISIIVPVYYAAGKIEYTTDYKSAYKDVDAIFIGVGTPELAHGQIECNRILLNKLNIKTNLLIC